MTYCPYCEHGTHHCHGCGALLTHAECGGWLTAACDDCYAVMNAC